MDDYYVDWNRELIDLSDDVLGMSKREWREKIKADTDVFLAEGGEIEYLPYDWTKEIMARVGRWTTMGGDSIEEAVQSDPYL